MAAIVAGENALLSFTILDSNGDPVPAAEIQAVTVSLFQSGILKQSWSSNGATPPNMAITDGLVKLEIPGATTQNLIYQIEAKLSITFDEASMFYSLGEIDIVCFPDLFEVRKCST